MDKPLHVLAFSGSLRQGSYNRSLLYAMQELSVVGIEIEVCNLSAIPLFNQDLEESHIPHEVVVLKEQIKKADAIIFSGPEYNFSVSGVLKNAIDWASRPRGDNSWSEKPVLIVSTSNGMLGGIRMQYHLRQICTSLGMHPLNNPEVVVPFASEKFIDGTLADDPTKVHLTEALHALIRWVKRLKVTK